MAPELMIDRQHGYVIFECDECGEVFDNHERDFDAAWDEAKSDGWRAHKDYDDGWEHLCPRCSL